MLCYVMLAETSCLKSPQSISYQFEKSVSCCFFFSLFSCRGRDIVIILLSNFFVSSRIFGKISFLPVTILLDILGNKFAFNSILLDT